MAGNRLETAATALFLVAIISVPTASKKIEYPDKRVSKSPIISTESQTHIDVEIDTENPSTARIEHHNSLYKVRQTPRKRIESLTTPQGVLKKIRTNNSRISKIKTPYGTLTTGIKEGRKISRFQGLNRSRVKKILEKLSRRSEIYHSRVKQQMLPEIEIKILKNRADDPDEALKIENQEAESLKLSGWKIVNSDGDSYEFKNLDIPAMGQAIVHTAAKDDLNVTEQEDREYVYSTGVDWDQGEEDASLFNIRGVEVASDSYS